MIVATRSGTILDFRNGWPSGLALPADRGTVATYVDADGKIRTAASNEPRIQHDPVTGAAIGRLVEPERENIWTRSKLDTGVTYTRCSRATVNDPTSPFADGECQEVTMSADVGSKYFFQNLTFTTGVKYVVSVFAKAGQSMHEIQFNSCAEGDSPKFELNDLTTTGGGPEWSNARIEYWGDGWYRCIANYTPATATQNFGLAFDDPDEGDVIRVRHMQIELGNEPSMPIETLGAAATRSADNAAGLSSFFGDDVRENYTMFAVVRPSWGVVSAESRFRILANPSTLTEHQIYYNPDGSNPKLIAYSGGNMGSNVVAGSGDDRLKIGLRHRDGAQQVRYDIEGAITTRYTSFAGPPAGGGLNDFWETLDPLLIGRIIILKGAKLTNADFAPFMDARLADALDYRSALFLGDSLSNSLTENNEMRARGWQAHALIQSGGRLDIIKDPNGTWPVEWDWGQSGMKAETAATDPGGLLTSAVAESDERTLVTIQFGRNDDVAGRTPAQIAGDIKTIYDFFITNNRKPVVIGIAPSEGEDQTTASAKLANDAIKLQCEADGVEFVDVWDAMFPFDEDRYYDDPAVHHNALGGSILGELVAPVFSKYRPIRPRVPTIFSLNPDLTGASGTDSPTNWDPYVGSLVVLSQGYVPGGTRGDWLEVTLENTSPTQTRGFQLTRIQADGYGIGESLVATCDIETETLEGAGIRNIDFWLEDTTAGVVQEALYMSNSDRTAADTAGKGWRDFSDNGRVATPPYVAANNDGIGTSLTVYLHPESTMKLRVRNFGLTFSKKISD
ncbi:MAG: SGNH/GDSL hydrolase family protein [Verrucomicrobiota bacterium]